MKPLDQTVCERARRLCSVHSERTVAELLGIARSSIWKAKRRGWRAAETTHPYRRRPSDFAIQARRATVDELARFYGTSTRCITRWRREIGKGLRQP